MLLKQKPSKQSLEEIGPRFFFKIASQFCALCRTWWIVRTWWRVWFHALRSRPRHATLGQAEKALSLFSTSVSILLLHGFLSQSVPPALELAAFSCWQFPPRDQPLRFYGASMAFWSRTVLLFVS